MRKEKKEFRKIMKPLKAAVPLAKWLLRFSLLFFILVLYLNTVLSLDYKNMSFIIAAFFVLFGILLIIGGFLPKASMTVISGLIIFILSIYKIVVAFDGVIEPKLVNYFMTGAIGFYFFARGNLG